jgi:phosphatidate cytidylyltransferase
LDSSKTRTLGPRFAVGLSLGGVFLLSLLHPFAFTSFAAISAAIATFELARVLRLAGWHVPAGAALAAPTIVYATYFYGTLGQWFSLLGSLGLLVIWRLVSLLIVGTQQSPKQTLRDFGATGFSLVYVPLLLSYAALLINQDDGTAWVLGIVLAVVMIDSFGYLVGRFFGKTKLIPSISPKKTWEGFLASALGALLGGIILGQLTETSLGFALLFGISILVSSVLGDLSESLIKRDLNVKDMGDVLPGHGGFMDRIDSLLPSVFVAYLLAQVAF